MHEGGQSNYPDQVAHQAALAIEQLLTGRKETDLIIVLISGEVMIFFKSDDCYRPVNLVDHRTQQGELSSEVVCVSA